VGFAFAAPGLWALRLTPARAGPGPQKVALLVGVDRYRARHLADKLLQYAEAVVEDGSTMINLTRLLCCAFENVEWAVRSSCPVRGYD